ncbi:hypothetical protein C3L33_15227, partial [Rhododendron williamsianum]
MTVAEEGSSEKHLGGGGDNDGIGSVVETCAADCVTCPVCGNTVPGGDYMINSHLGLYLLLIFRLDSFFKLLFTVKSWNSIKRVDQVGVNVVQRAPDNILCDTLHKLHDCRSVNGDNTTQYKALMNSESVLSTDSSAENKITNCGADSPMLLPENKMPKYEMNETMDMSGQLLKTFVVGRLCNFHSRTFSDVLPIQITCQNEIFSGEKECEDLQVVRRQARMNNCYCLDFGNKSGIDGHGQSQIVMTTSPWFRISNLSYPEISDYNQAIKELSATGYMCSVGSISDLQDNDLKEVLYLLTVSELREVLCKLKKKCKPGTRKQDFIALLLSSYADGLCPVLPNVVLEKTGPCVQISLSAESLFWCAERLFFLNGEQDLSAFLLVDLGIIKYPNYNCIISKQIFSSRNDFLAYEEAIEVAQVMDQSLDENSTEFVLRCIGVSDSRISNSSHEETRSLTSESPAAFLSCFSAVWVYSKVVLLGVSFLERERRYKDAIILLKQLLKHFTSDRRRGYWTLRLSIDLEHVGCLNESLSVAEDGLLDPSVRAGSRMALQRRVLRLGKPPRRWKTPSFSESVKRKITEMLIHLFIAKDLGSGRSDFLGTMRLVVYEGLVPDAGCIRFFTSGPWFRISNLSYPEISDYNQAIKELSATGYMCSVGSISDLQDNDLKEVLYLLTVSELREVLCKLKKRYGWFLLNLVDSIVYAPKVMHWLLMTTQYETYCVDRYGHQKCKPGTRKQDFIALLLSSYADGLCPVLPNVVLEKTGPCVQISLSAESLFWCAERLFFLNGEQDLSAFLLVDLGIIKYPNYNCIISKQIFSSRNDFLAYEEAIEVAQVMDQSLDENSTEFVLRCIGVSDSRISNSSHEETRSLTSESPAAFLSCFSAVWVYSKVVLLGVSFLERERRYKDAIILLKQLLKHFTSDRRRGYWTLRLSIDLEHVGCLNESLSVAEDGLLDPSVRAGSRMALQRRVLRLGKPPRRWKTPSFSESVKRKITEVHVQGRPLNCRTGTKSRFYGEDGEQCGVEELAMQYYGGEGGAGSNFEDANYHSSHHCIGFAKKLMLRILVLMFIATAPLDLETDSFYEVRKTIIEPILVKIYDGAAEEILITSWETNLGTSCRGVNWNRHSLSELRAAVTCIGGPCLASFCRHLAQDYRSWSSGMPDLLLWRFHGDYRGEAKLVEVKGPTIDSLSSSELVTGVFRDLHQEQHKRGIFSNKAADAASVLACLVLLRKE